MRKAVLIWIACLGLVTLFALDRWQVGHWRAEKSIELRAVARLVKLRLENSIASRFASLEALAALFALHPNTPPEAFERFAARILKSNPPVRALQYADAATRVVYVYPAKGNEVTIREPMLLSADPERGSYAVKAIRQKRAVLQGPFELRQGGMGVVVRSPIFKDSTFIGLAVGVYDIPVLINSALAGIDLDRFDFTLLDSQGHRFWGAETSAPPGGDGRLEDPIQVADTQWKMRLAWQPSAANPPSRVRVIVWSCGVGFLVSVLLLLYQSWASSRNLETVVALRTKDLALANLELNKEIDDRKEIEQKLRASEKKYQELYDQAPDMYVSLDAKTATVIGCNQTTLDRLAYAKDEIVGNSVFDLYTPESAEIAKSKLFPAFLKTGRVKEEDLQLRRKDGGKIDVSLNVRAVYDAQGRIVQIRSMWRDVTEKKQMQSELQQVQKMESIGTLAGGIAHEINNPITGIMNYAQLIKDRLAPKNELADFAGEIIQETQRVATIVRNLLTFARNEQQAHRPAKMASIIDETVSLVQAVVRHDQITLETDIPGDLPAISCRSQQIQQVLMNLITNARDALNERYSGYHEKKTMRISAKRHEKDGQQWVRTTIEDHGPGIPDDIRDRIFDPFFTTKPKERGTGLGLSISYGIVKDHQGELSCESVFGRYTKFTMDLPAARDGESGS